MSKLSIELRDMARKAGLCDLWFGKWRDESSNAILFDKYKRGIDFCIEKNYPTNEYIKLHWDKDTLQENNIFVDDKGVERDSLRGVVIINGDSDITLNFEQFDVADIYVRHTSKLKIRAKGSAKIMVSLYDNSEIEKEEYDEAKIFVYDKRKE